MTESEAMAVLRGANLSSVIPDWNWSLQHVIILWSGPSGFEETNIADKIALAIETLSQSKACLPRCGDRWIDGALTNFHDPNCPNAEESE